MEEPTSYQVLVNQIRDFILLRVKEHETSLEHFLSSQASLRIQLQENKISLDLYNSEMDILDQKYRRILLEFQLIDKQFRLVAQDMEDEVFGMKAIGIPAANQEELVEKAYYAVVREAMESEILINTSALADYSMEERSALDKRALNYYSASRIMHNQRQAHCSITGWYPEDEVHVARLVPREVSASEAASIFGAQAIDLFNGKNCVPLHKNLAKALDYGIITFVPLPPPAPDHSPTWTCVLVDDRLSDSVFAVAPSGKKLTYRAIHGYALTFHTHHRPARRFLYFHFILSYLRAASQGFPVKPNIAWPTPGRYVDKDTLVQLCNCISGTEVPELLYNGMVFQRVEHPGDYADVALCLSLRGWARKPLNLEEVCLRPPSEGGGDLGDGHKNGNVGKALVPQQSSDGQGIGAKQQKEDDKQDIELSIQTDDAGWGEAHQSGAIKASQDERPVEIKQREADDNLGTSMSALAKEVLPQEKLGGEYEGEVEKGGIGPQESHTGHHVEAMQEEEDDNTGANLSVPVIDEKPAETETSTPSASTKKKNKKSKKRK